MTGMSWVLRSALSSRSTSNPDFVGSARSSRIASGACARACCRPSSPFLASTTAKPSPASKAVVIVRVQGSSSITSMVFWASVSTVIFSLPEHQKGNIPVWPPQGPGTMDDPERRVERILAKGLECIDTPEAAHAVVDRLERLSAGLTEAQRGDIAAEQTVAAADPGQAAAATV